MKAESVLMLFPMRKIAMEIMKNLKEHYRFSIIVLSPDDKEYYKRQTGAAAGAEVVLIPDDIPRFWREHAPLPADILSPVRNVINFMGNDWLTMHIDGAGAQWSIDESRIEQKNLFRSLKTWL
ncbi:MAG: hypothetical protein P8107_11880 [Spirochaetia bacterium]